MRRCLVVSVLAVLFCLPAASATLPELFIKVKEQFKLGNYAKALEMIETLDSASTNPGFEQERQKLLPGLLFYRGACLSALGSTEEAVEVFGSFLAYQPTAQLDPALYPPKVIAAFEKARKSASAPPRTKPEEAGALAAAYRAFRPPESEPRENAGEDWAGGPAKYILTAAERDDFERLSDPRARAEFIVAFWKARDPKAETPENEFRGEFDERVAFSDARFTQDETRGSLTDRGMVFILVGPPTYNGQKPLTLADEGGAAEDSGQNRYSRTEVASAHHAGGSNTNQAAAIASVTGPGATISRSASNWIETWHYLRADLPKDIPYQELAFQFMTKEGYGKNVLQREPNVITALERAKKVTRPGNALAGKNGS